MPHPAAHQGMVPSVTITELALAYSIGGLVPQLYDMNLVLAVLPGGEEHLVKGLALLSDIAAGERSRSVKQTKLSVPSIELAIALEESLGSDGNLVRAVFGDKLVFGSGQA